MTKYQILLYYKYTNIEDPKKLSEDQKLLCKKLNLKSRIIIAKEGINGTLEGRVEETEKYIKKMQADQRFKDIHFKRSKGNGNAFPKISVKVRDEIVALNLNHDIDPNKLTGKYITAEELHDLYEEEEEFYVVDMRNDREYKVGYFENSFLMPLKNFRDIPENLKKIEHLKDKKVITVCTGGIRCEKASGFLVANGFNNVYKLAGGMHTYMEKYPNEHFLGKLYVFDGRVTMGFNIDDPKHQIVSNCDICGGDSDNYVDCDYIHCKGLRHFIGCKDCHEENGLVFCSKICKEKYYEGEFSPKIEHRIMVGEIDYKV